jgi:hypothetical protein
LNSQELPRSACCDWDWVLERPMSITDQFWQYGGRLAAKAERFDGNREARQALALSVAGVMAVMLMWNLIMLFLY